MKRGGGSWSDGLVSRLGPSLRRLIPPTPLSRRLATQSLLFATAEGTFLTGSAVFFTQVVGLRAAQVGLGLTVAGVASFLVAYPAGKLTAYILDVMPEDERVATQAYMYSALNVGFTIGAIIGGVALAFDNLTVMRWMPLFTLAIGLANAAFIWRLPRAPCVQ